MQEAATELVYTKEVIKFDVTEAAIAEVKQKYMALTITGIDDKDGYEKVDKARKKVVKMRTSVTKHGKALREDATAYNRRVKAREDEIVGLLEPIETHLKTEQGKIDAELERIKAEEAAKEQARIQSMIDELLKYGSSLPVLAVATMSDEEYTTVLSEAKAAWIIKQEREAEAKRLEDERIAKEEAQRKAESDRLAAEKKRQEEEAAKLKAEQEAIEKQKKDIARQTELTRERAMKPFGLYRGGYERDVVCHESDFVYHGFPIKWTDLMMLGGDDFSKWLDDIEQQIEKYRKELADKAKKAAEEKAASESLAKAAAELRAKEEAERQESLRPDRERLEAFAQFIENGISWPVCESKEADQILSDAAKVIQELADEIYQRAQAL